MHLLKRITDLRFKGEEVILGEGENTLENEPEILSHLSIEVQASGGTVNITEQAESLQPQLDKDNAAFPLQCLARTQQIPVDGSTEEQLDNKGPVITNSKQPVTVSYHDQQATSSNITTLPFEILSHIFVIYTFADPGLDFKPASPSIPHKRRGPLHVCSVSRQWRQVALTTPSLWSSILVRHPGDLGLVRLWLERSGSCPLALGLAQKFGRDKTPEDSHFTEAALSLFATQIHRWRRISFRFQDLTAKAFTDLPLSTATLLHEVTLYTDWRDPEVSNSVFGALSACPRVRHLTWSAATGRRDIPLSPESIFWSQLNSLNLRCTLSIDDHITLLRHSPNISRFSLWTMSGGSSQKDHPHTTLPHLQELILQGSAYDSSEVFNCFTMPALQHLSITHRSIECYYNFRALLDRSHCRLERFKLVDYFLAQSDVLNFLQDPLFSSIPSFSFEVTSQIIDQHACLAALKGSSPGRIPAFEEQYGGGIWIHWGEQP
ncbi:hypothetical protein B0H34DRAFT_161545 [Crassisporium funariophilum]|nr:hypothetical protein B0H34DRAFT_161545 [Crassisporium funariophilum]